MNIISKSTRLLVFGSLLSCNTLAFAASDFISCNGPYALCSNVNCTKQADGHTAQCICNIYEGTNLGTTSCSDRSDAAKQGKPYSEYAPRHLLAGGALGSADAKESAAFYPEQLCTGQGRAPLQYADCWNVQGTANADGSTATFICLVAEVDSSAGFWMQAANCQQGADYCQKFSSPDSPVVINGAQKELGLDVMNTAMTNTTGHGLTPAYFCATPSQASPSSSQNLSRAKR